MKKIISIGIFLFLLMGYGNLEAQQNAQNPRLRNFRYGTGQAQWWENKTPNRSPQPRIVYPPTIRYYQPFPYYSPHYFQCRCLACMHRHRRTMMYQWQLNPQGFFLFQFRF